MFQFFWGRSWPCHASGDSSTEKGWAVWWSYGQRCGPAAWEVWRLLRELKHVAISDTIYGNAWSCGKSYVFIFQLFHEASCSTPCLTCCELSHDRSIIWGKVKDVQKLQLSAFSLLHRVHWGAVIRTLKFHLGALKLIFFDTHKEVLRDWNIGACGSPSGGTQMVLRVLLSLF